MRLNHVEEIEVEVFETLEKESFISDYGIDLTNIRIPYEGGFADDRMKSYAFCRDCLEYKSCKGKNWENCKYRKEALEIMREVKN